MANTRVAIVHERFTEFGGSELVAEQLAMEWPDAAVHVPISTPEAVPVGLSAPPVTTWLDAGYRMLGQRSYAPLAPALPRAFRGMRLGDVDVVVASHHAFATQVVFATEAPVIAYVHSPARWAWDPELRAQESGGAAGAAVLAGLSRVARNGELAAVGRLHQVLANSTAVADRIARWWGRESTVIHPPVDTVGYCPDSSVEREDFFLLAGRLVPYKRPDLAIRAAKLAGKKLVVAGEGRAMDACRELAGPDTVFLGRVTHEELLKLFRSAKAVLMPGIEDFGIVPVEAMATGTPVIALGEGGALDTVVPERSGFLVSPGSDDVVVGGLAAAMQAFRPTDYHHGEIRAWAEGFSRENFRSQMRGVVDGAVGGASAAA